MMRPSLLLSVLMLVPACGMASSWVAAPEVVQGPSAGREIRGMVFEDRDGDGRRQPGEAGVAGVLVSNGLDVVRTDEQGGYVLPLREDMDLFVIQPSGWQVPVDERNVPRFSHTHKPGGSPVPLRFGGLADTGPAPAQVNFPLRRTSAARQRFTCAVIGDSQTYSNQEIEQFRDSAITDLLERDNGPNDCAIYLGDVVGDDLGLLPRLLQVGSVTGLPQWAVAGNHDVDFDAPDDAHSLDSWRRLWGPAYYAFEIGEVLFVALDNVVYPCNADDAARPGRESCANGRRPGYNARVTDTQMEWLSNLLEHTPRERLIVLLHHIPLVSYTSADSPIHQTDNAAQIHQLLKGRPALSLSGHTHTLENHDPGQHYAGWKEMVGLGPLPFRHIVAGAASGRWWQGDFGIDGTAMALTDLGEPKGVLMLDFDGIEYAERYVGSRLGERGQWIDLNTPSFRAWFKTLDAWRLERAPQRDPLPPVSINDLPDTRSFTRQELLEGVWITANFWHGSASSRVEASINGGPPITLARTQEGAGEESRRGSEYADPFAIKRQASIGRYAIQSRSGQERNQGWEGGRGSANRGVPQPSGWAERSTHLWRAALPTDLEEGVHTLRVTSTDRNGRRWSDVLTFEVRAEHPPRRHRRELWR